MVRENKNVNLVRLNLDEAVIPESFGKREIGINRDLCIGFQHKKDTKYAPAIRHQPKRYLVSEKSIFNLREDYYSRFFSGKVKRKILREIDAFYF